MAESPATGSSDRTRVQLRDVAKHLDLNISTVCRALKSDYTVSAKTRARVRAAAAELGYQPDPILTALSHYRRRLRKSQYQATLAWLTNFPEREGWKVLRWPRLYWAGAEARAKDLGYKLEPFWLREPRMRPERLAEVLVSRGVPGVIFAPQPAPGMRIEFPCQHFSCVTIGQTLSAPLLHRVGAHYHQLIRQAFIHLAELGYRRIGLVSNLASAHRTLYAQESLAHAIGAYRVAGGIPPFALRSLLATESERSDFMEWFDRHRPDGVISLDQTVSGVRSLLETKGLRPPRDYGLLTLTEPETEAERVSWMDQNEWHIGAEAVELVALLVNRGERGEPNVPNQYLVGGQVREAGSLRRLGSPNTELLEFLA